MKRIHRAACIKIVGPLLIATLAACGGSKSPAPITVPNVPNTPNTQLSVAGTYPTAVAIVSDACGGSVVQANPTAVTHAAGSTSLVLTHAGSTYPGTVETNGNFTTSPSGVTIGAATYTVAMTGKFTATGFTSTVNVDKVDSAHPTGCRYVVAWTATKSGEANVIPGLRAN